MIFQKQTISFKEKPGSDILEIKQIRLSKMATFCYVVGDESSKTCALIDPAFNAKRILDEVGQGGYEVTHIINTHCHSDHTAGNAAMKVVTGAKLLIHELDAKRLNKRMNRVFSRLLGGKGSPEPDILLKDGDVINIGQTALKVIHTPGHSIGSICLYTDSNLFTGDTLFVGAVGRTDLPGGSAKQLLKAIREKIYTLPGNTTIWPGHDYGPFPNSTIKREKDTNPFTMSP
ncbi:MAG: MBL fold metallo-hydrolase [Desulfobacteraceae bacterium]|nr:MBL fold metallo-hydrolase [Desulfobacteraceae bacterium]